MEVNGAVVTVHAETWPIRGMFRIARGARTESQVVVVEISDGTATGRGECVPYQRYGETVEQVIATIRETVGRMTGGMDRLALADELPAGAARNALDCALWDLAAKRAGRRVWDLAGLPEPRPLTTAYTISLDEPGAMGTAALAEAHRPLLKLKLTGELDLDRVRTVREAAPATRIIADANEAWTPSQFAELARPLAELGVEMIEQPFPADRDDVLLDIERPLLVAADESCHTSDDVRRLVGRYDVVNLKLDKTGGLTEGLRLVTAARDAGLELMVGCMVGTSLGVAPAILLAQGARYVDLDAPLLLARDRPEGLRYDGSTVYLPRQELWG
jgi:L-alanine-DL-glutamate epimerase-like enolase superfamily enzyme